MKHFTIEGTNAKFERFSLAMGCAVLHARQWGECIVREIHSGEIIVRLSIIDDGATSVVVAPRYREAVSYLHI